MDGFYVRMAFSAGPTYCVGNRFLALRRQLVGIHHSILVGDREISQAGLRPVG